MVAVCCLLVCGPLAALAAPPFAPGALANPYPRLCLAPSQVALVQDRLAREPYATLYAQVLSRARATAPTAADLGSDQRRATIAKAAAFVFALGAAVTPEAERIALAKKAESLLSGLDPESHINGLFDFSADLVDAERLHPWAMAYDLLRAGSHTFTSEAAVRERLADLASNLYDDFALRYQMVFASFSDNHTIKVASAVGMTAMALDGYEPASGDPRAALKRPAVWMAWSLDRVETLLTEAMTTDEGGYTEGPIYYQYSSAQHLAFLRAWHLYGAGATLPVSADHAVGDLWTAASFRAQQLWMLAVRMPDGSLPAFNDATPGGFYDFGMLSDHPQAAALHWAWRTGSGGPAAGSLAEETLCAYDDAISPIEPQGSPSRFLPEAGQAALRTGWGPDDVYLLLQAEHGKTYGFARRRDGRPLDGTAGHNHADPLSFILAAFGETLALDAGYLGWENHAKVSGPSHHNLLLVDGKGPKEPYLSIPVLKVVDGKLVNADPDHDGGWVAGGDGEAFLESGWDLGPLVVARATSSYNVLVSEPIDVARSVALLSGRAVALFDDASGKDAAHDFTWRLHGNAGGTSGGAFESVDGRGAVWRRPNATMAAAVASPDGPLLFAHALDVHDAGGWVEKQHEVLSATVHGTSARLSTLLVLTRAGEADATFEALTSGAGQLARFADGAITLSARGPALVFPQGSAQADALALTAAAGESWRALSARGLTRLTLGGLDVLESTAETTQLALSQDETRVRGFVKNVSPLTLRLARRAASVMGACVLEAEASGAVTSTRVVIPAGAREFEVVLGDQRQNSTPVAQLVAPAEGAAGAPVELDATGSCDADATGLTFTWKITHGQEGGSLAESGAKVRLSGPPGDYRIAVTVSDGELVDRAEVSTRLVPAPPASGCTSPGTRSATELIAVLSFLIWALARPLARPRGPCS